MADLLKRFIFDDAPVRGAIVQLDDAWRTVQERRSYPAGLQQVLGELLAASALLTSNIKFQGALIMQMHGHGPLKLAVVECSSEMTVRATAKWEGALDGLSLPQMIGDGKFVLTLDQIGAAVPYQGIVPLEGATVGEMLAGYMQRSEQLDTRLVLAANGQRAAGLLLQRLPEGHGDASEWDTLTQLLGTLSSPELLTLPPLEVLHRLFHQYQVRLLGDQEVHFGCRCSRDKVADMIRLLGRDEAELILREQGTITTVCEFCHTQYSFDPVDVEALFVQGTAPGSQTKH